MMKDGSKMYTHPSEKFAGDTKHKIIEWNGSIFSPIKLSYVIPLCRLLNLRTFHFVNNSEALTLPTVVQNTASQWHAFTKKGKQKTFELSAQILRTHTRPSIACKNMRACITQCNYLPSNGLIHTKSGVHLLERDGESGQRSSASLRLSSAELGSAGRAGQRMLKCWSIHEAAQARPAGPRGGCPVGVSHSLYMPAPPGGVSGDSSTQ